MKVAVIGSRSLTIDNIGNYLPVDTSEIVSGGATGIDRCAAVYAAAHDLPLTEILPHYERYGRAAPIIRNREIVAYADMVIALWDGISKGTAFVIKECEKQQKACRVVILRKH